MWVHIQLVIGGLLPTESLGGFLRPISASKIPLWYFPSAHSFVNDWLSSKLRPLPP